MRFVFDPRSKKFCAETPLFKFVLSFVEITFSLSVSNRYYLIFERRAMKELFMWNIFFTFQINRSSKKV